VICLILFLVPWIIIDGFILGMGIGNNVDLASRGMPIDANNGLLISRKLPEISSDGFTSKGYLEEELYVKKEPESKEDISREVWLYAYREVGTEDINMKEGMTTQSYIQITNPEEPGTYK